MHVLIMKKTSSVLFPAVFLTPRKVLGMLLVPKNPLLKEEIGHLLGSLSYQWYIY